ncbi:H-NS family nucleoid-associated regulatory protein [Paraburkholderia adhaesiva]|uniref:H-NS family nucleoid-associated regulatory protein n=1 Tax=Paraburkholderia adhaesiva TaxID=2883244 RepID=UPI001F260C1C|nr:H-NS family nucleoid-associated regulatory protein [Paraburkholderia adhaesiva]
MNGKIHDGEARERLIVWMRRRMAEFGITPQVLANSIQQDLDNAPIYRDAFGNEWNGSGVMPNWLRAARDAGVNPDFFRVAPVAHNQAPISLVNPRQSDLFR